MELQVTDLMLVWFPSDYHELLQATVEFSMMCWLLLLFIDSYWDTLVVIWSQEVIERCYQSTMTWKSPQIQYY